MDDSKNLMRRQIEEQRQTINALIRVVNYHTQYHKEYREAHNVMFKRHLYALTNWIRPIKLPLYRSPKCIPLLGRPDDVPVLLPGPLHDDVPMDYEIVTDAQVFTDEFLVGKEDES